MDRVHGTTLEQSWSEIGWFATIRMAFQLRKFVQAMRKTISCEAGGLVTGRCLSIWLDDFFELQPRATPEAVASYITFWLQYSYEKRRTYPNLEGYHRHRHLIPVKSNHFVFTHQDLAPRNLLVDQKNNIWIIDWQRSGWYPIYFEYASMQNFKHSWSMMMRLRWWIFSWISVGFYWRENRALCLVRNRSLTDTYARCVLPEIQEELRSQQSL